MVVLLLGESWVGGTALTLSSLNYPANCMFVDAAAQLTDQSITQPIKD